MAGNDLESLLSSLLGRGSSSDSPMLLGALFSGAGSAGGNPLKGLLGQLTAGGLAAKVDSWAGTGENEQASGAEIAQARPESARLGRAHR
ncbi:YidB family protein [Streptomyces sp. NPDC051453]|uniref:YidB family protein n=1 Tax=Streptomyces sp. NPDC051453 TaxID=3154941 RepID=UPI0034144656